MQPGQRLLINTATIIILFIILVAFLNMYGNKLNRMQEALSKGDYHEVQEEAKQTEAIIITAATKGPGIIILILAAIIAASIGAFKYQVSAYQRSLRLVAADNKLAVHDETFFSYPSATGSDGKSMILIETEKTQKGRKTVVNVSLDHYHSELTYKKKAYRHEAFGSQKTQAAMSKQAIENIEQTDGDWAIRAAAITYEEEKVITNPEKLQLIINTAKLIRRDLKD